MSGCLPILVQIPVFFALYKVLFVTIEMRQMPFLWLDLQDLSRERPNKHYLIYLVYCHMMFLVIFNDWGAWPIAMGLSNVCSSKN